MTAAIEAWAKARPFILSALIHGDGAYQIEDVEQGIEAGSMAFLSTENSALVIEVCTFPRLKALNVLFAGGDLAEIKGTYPQLEFIAKNHGCSRIYLSGRRGWVRALADLGFSDVCATVSKKV